MEIAEDVTRAYIDGRNDGRRGERARVRAELLAWYEDVETEELLRDALDRICPEEEHPVTTPGAPR